MSNDAKPYTAEEVRRHCDAEGPLQLAVVDWRRIHATVEALDDAQRSEREAFRQTDAMRTERDAARAQAAQMREALEACHEQQSEQMRLSGSMSPPAKLLGLNDKTLAALSSDAGRGYVRADAGLALKFDGGRLPILLGDTIVGYLLELAPGWVPREKYEAGLHEAWGAGESWGGAGNREWRRQDDVARIIKGGNSGT